MFNLNQVKMKKILFFVTLLLCANLMFGQSITMGIHDGVDNDNSIDVSALSPGDKVYISLSVDAIDPNSEIWGMGLFFNVPGGYLSWDGTGAVPMPGVTYVNPLFPPVVLPANVAVNWYLNGTTNIFGYLQGDGGSFVDLDGQTFPVTILTLKFTYLGGVAPGTSIPITYSVDFKAAGDFMVGGVTEVYYNDFFEVFPGQVLAPGAVLYGGPGGPVTKVWTGAGGDTDWFNPANWAPPGVPTTEDVMINSSKAPMVVIAGGVATTGMLTVAAGAGITVASDGGLTTNGLFTNNGDFIIESDNSLGYAGSYIDNGGIAGIGNFMFNRYVICSGTLAGTGNPYGWHYLSAPLDGFSTDGLPEFFVNAWDQPTGMWMQYEGPIGLPCTPLTPPVALGTMDAWSINLDLDYGPNCGAFDQTANFIAGAAGVHTGAYGAGLGFGAGPYQEWNMVGNPYPSGLDVNTIAWGPNTVQAAYYYDGCSGNYVYWATGMGTYVMAPALGFMVETTGADVLGVNNANRAHNADWYWKNEVANLLTLKASGNDRSDVLNVRFANDVTAGFDLNGDAHKLFAETEGLPQIYTLAGEEKLAINALPETTSIPMGFVANGSGSYTIEAIETSEFENVVLEDLVLGVQTDLLNGSYTFEYAEGDDANRFVIHFTPLGVNDNLANAINIWAANKTIYVQAPATTGDIVVYNLMGQEVVRTTIEAGINEIPMNDVNTYYVVKVLGSEVTETGKVFIK
jgi:hypothetical protein